MKERTYICCDLKSFYASVECVERGLDPMTTNLVVADLRRTEKTICLAVTPSLKAYGISGRARLFEVVQKVAEVNARRRQAAPGRQLTGSSWNDPEVQNDPSLALDYIVAPPRMAHYIDWSTKIYGVYLKYLAPEDIFPYSIDEVFMDVTNYLDTYKMTARDLARTIILDILKTTGITAAAGMGPNLYLAKIAMDIVAKHVHPDKDGVRIAKLNEMTYRQLLWTHRPLTDFWRIGRGYATKLEAHGLYTMGDIARCSIGKPTDYHNEEMLYRLFGVNAELLIDHAWGWEPCTIADVKAYKPENKSIVSGQVLQCPYSFDKARLVVREMADALALDLVDKGLVTNQLVLTVGYDIENLVFTQGTAAYTGAVTTDCYGRKICVSVIPIPDTASAVIWRFWAELIPLLSVIAITLIFWLADQKKIRLHLTGKPVYNIILGGVTGTIWLGASVGILSILGVVQIEGKNQIAMLWLWLLAAFLNTVMQEMLVRGYLYQMIKNNGSIAAAIIVSTGLFTFAHGGAFEAGILPVLNVITMSLFMTAVLEYTGSLIAPIVIHFLWNGVGAIILGGVSLAEDYPHLFDMTIHGNPILSGGSCKIEGSIIVLFMNLAFLIGFVAAKKRKDRNR